MSRTNRLLQYAPLWYANMIDPRHTMKAKDMSDYLAHLYELDEDEIADVIIDHFTGVRCAFELWFRRQGHPRNPNPDATKPIQAEVTCNERPRDN